MADFVDEVYTTVAYVGSAEAVVADGDEVAILGFGYGWDSVRAVVFDSVKKVLFAVGGEGGGDGLTVCGELIEDDLIGLGSVVGELAVIARVALSLSYCPLFCLGDSDGDSPKLTRLCASIEVECYVA